jgi:hypothetical protein
MIPRRNVILLLSVLIAGAVTAVSLTRSPAQEEVTYPIQLEVDPSCQPSQPSKLVLTEKYQSEEYRFYILNSLSYVISKYSLGACKVLNPTGSAYRLTQLLPEELVPKFSDAWWKYRIEEAGGKAELEKQLASTRLVYGLNSEILYSEDLASWKALGIKYPNYFRSADSFASDEEIAAYYSKIYTPEWDKNHPEQAD